jgi:DNA gyrase/topoisomerase IV subunit A
MEDLDALLEELLAWLQRCENQILDAESQPLSEEIDQIEKLIEEHTNLMEHMCERQHDVDTVCKTKPAPLVTEKRGIPGKKSRLVRILIFPHFTTVQ